MQRVYITALSIHIIYNADSTTNFYRTVRIKSFLLHLNSRVFHHDLTFFPSNGEMICSVSVNLHAKACKYEARDWISVAKCLAVIL